MAILVLTGLASALMKGFEVKFMGVLRALFVSPRYVWRKGDNTPDVLSQDKAVDPDAKKGVKAATTPAEDAAIVDFLNTRSRQRDLNESESTTPGDNFERVYSGMFGDVADSSGVAQRPDAPEQRVVGAPTGLAGPSAAGELLRTGPNQQVVVQPVQNQAPHALTPNSELSAPSAPSRPASIAESGKVIFGVVVDKDNKPIAGAVVKLYTPELAEIGETQSGADGRFKLSGDIQVGEYVADVKAAGYKFPEYKLNITEGHLPAYKFRGQ